MEGRQHGKPVGYQQGLKERYRLHGDAKKHVSRHGQENISESSRKRKGRLPPGEDVTRSVSVLTFETAFFF